MHNKLSNAPVGPRGNAGVVVAIILAVVALIVAIISVFFYMNLWSNDQTTPRGYAVPPKAVSKNVNVANENTNTSETVQLTTPKINSTVTSPIEIAGSAPGTWFFEAVFPITLVDGDGTELARTQAHATGDWMTTDQVEFTASLEYTATETKTVELVFQPDNPSGMPSATSYSIPVTLTATE